MEEDAYKTAGQGKGRVLSSPWYYKLRAVLESPLLVNL